MDERVFRRPKLRKKSGLSLGSFISSSRAAFAPLRSRFVAASLPEPARKVPSFRRVGTRVYRRVALLRVSALPGSGFRKSGPCVAKLRMAKKECGSRRLLGHGEFPRAGPQPIRSRASVCFRVLFARMARRADGDRCSSPFAEPSDRNAEHFAVLGHRAPRDAVAFGVEDIHQHLVRQRLALVLLVDALRAGGS